MHRYHNRSYYSSHKNICYYKRDRGLSKDKHIANCNNYEEGMILLQLSYSELCAKKQRKVLKVNLIKLPKLILHNNYP